MYNFRIENFLNFQFLMRKLLKLPISNEETSKIFNYQRGKFSNVQFPIWKILKCKISNEQNSQNFQCENFLNVQFVI